MQLLKVLRLRYVFGICSCFTILNGCFRQRLFRSLGSMWKVSRASMPLLFLVIEIDLFVCLNYLSINTIQYCIFQEIPYNVNNMNFVEEDTKSICLWLSDIQQNRRLQRMLVDIILCEKYDVPGWMHSIYFASLVHSGTSYLLYDDPFCQLYMFSCTCLWVNGLVIIVHWLDDYL